MDTLESAADYSEFEKLLAPAADCRGIFGDYEVLDRLGCGSAGIVYVARKVKLRTQRVVLKILKPSQCQIELARQRFHRESSKVATHFHDHIMPVVDVGEVSGLPYFAMPFVAGTTLEAKVAEGLLPIEDVVRFGAEIAEGLSAAHNLLGIIHRDLKPSNIWIVDSTGFVKLLDFGLALPLSSNDPRLSTHTIALGTPLYCSPEQAKFQFEYDHRSDLFSLGTVLYQLATGELPFEGDNIPAVLHKIAHNDPVLAHQRNSRTPIVLSQVISKLMMKNPADRYIDANAVAGALRSAIQHDHGQWNAHSIAPAEEDMRLAESILKVDQHRIKVPFGHVVALTTTSIVCNQLRRTVDKLLHQLETLEDEIAQHQPFDMRDIKSRAKTMVIQYSHCVDRTRIIGLLDNVVEEMDSTVGQFLEEIVVTCDNGKPSIGRSVGALSRVIGTARVKLKELGLQLEKHLQQSDGRLHDMCMTP